MQLNYAVVHNLVKEAGTNEARTVLATVLLRLDNAVVIDLVDDILELIGKRENMAYYGVFRDDAASTRIPSIVKSYCMEAEPTPDDFLELTNDCMTALCDKARSQNWATGGYLLFADYTNKGRRFLLVAMIKQRSGITMQGLVPTSITELDLRKLHQVARVAFDRLRQYDKASAEQQDMTYIEFVSPKGNRQAAGYFIESLGCEPVTPAAAATKAVIAGTDNFFRTRESIQSGRYEARVGLIELLQRKADNKERVSLLEVVEVVRGHFPPEEADKADNLANELVMHLQKIHRVPAEFPVPKAVVNRYTRFKYQSKKLKVEIEKAAVTREDGNPIYFDEERNRLVIWDRDFIAKLSAFLRDDV